MTPFLQRGRTLSSRATQGRAGASGKPLRLTAVATAAWRQGYRLALANALVFLGLSWSLLVVDSASLTGVVCVTTLFLVGSLASFVLLVRSGGAFAALAWYVLGTGVYFGIGVLVGGLAPDARSVHYYAESVLLGDLLRVNTLNSSSIALVLIAAAPLAYHPKIGTRSGPAPTHDIEDVLLKVFPALVLLSFASVALQLFYFPMATNLVVRTFLSSAYLVIPFCLLSVGMLWSRLDLNWALLGAMLFTSALALSLLTMSKFGVMSNVVALLVGTWAYHRSRRAVTVGLLVLGATFVAITPLVNEGRAHLEYDAATNSPLTRLTIVADIVSGNGSSSSAELEGDSSATGPPLRRFAIAEIQAYLIQRYEDGQPGASLADFWAAAIPRVFWPDKPIITRFGADLHGQFWEIADAQSALAPSYSAEAYWNYGPLGVLIVSIVIGLEIGWLTRGWHRASAGQDLAFFVIAFPVALWASFVESWIAASYVGGFVTIVLLWYIARFLLVKLFAGSLNPVPSPLRTLAR